MRKNQFFAIAALLSIALTGCLKSTPSNDLVYGDGSEGWLMVRLVDNGKTHTRALSDEHQGQAEERKIFNLRVVTFTETGVVVPFPGTPSAFYTTINMPTPADGATPITPSSPIKVSAAAKRLLVIANAGPKMLDALNAINSSTTFDVFNKALEGIDPNEIVDIETTQTRGFTMISAGNDTGLNTGDKISNPLVDITGHVKVVSATLDDAAAQAAALADDVDVLIERLSSKAIVKVPAVVQIPVNSSFNLLDWTVDAVNSTTYPWAVKNIIAADHAPGAYLKNFYTADPNFVDGPTVHTGIVYATVDATTYAPVLPWTNATTGDSFYGWKSANDAVYFIENTMDAGAQRFGNATRIVLRAQYAPDGFTLGQDWFHWAGVNYRSLADLQTAYAAVATDPNSELKKACDAFYNKVKGFKGSITAAGFATLTAADLAQITDLRGGEVVKNGRTPVIRWYQGSQNYYYYEIRHNNDPLLGTMAFGKYGVVRNNWYNLTLNSVSGPGTPWYPDINNPGEGDPDPYDPIDSAIGYVGITINVQPWILWESKMDI